MLSLLIKLLITCLITGIGTTFLGWIIHWALHQPWSLQFYRAHMNHHTIQYPPTQFLSNKYKDAGKDNTVILFGVAFIPIIIVLLVSMIFGVISLATGLCTLANLGAWGFLHNYFHDQFHIADSWWKKFPMFLRLRALHYIHHLNLNLNYGILVFQWDKLFKTYDNTVQEIPQ